MVIGYGKWIQIMRFPDTYNTDYKYGYRVVDEELSKITTMNNGGWSAYEVEDKIFKVMKSCARARMHNKMRMYNE